MAHFIIVGNNINLTTDKLVNFYPVSHILDLQQYKNFLQNIKKTIQFIVINFVPINS